MMAAVMEKLPDMRRQNMRRNIWCEGCGLGNMQQSLAMGLATTLGGFIITQDSAGLIVGYPKVGYLAVAANLLAIWYVSRIVMHDQHATLPDVVPK